MPNAKPAGLDYHPQSARLHTPPLIHAENSWLYIRYLYGYIKAQEPLQCMFNVIVLCLHPSIYVQCSMFHNVSMYVILMHTYAYSVDGIPDFHVVGILESYPAVVPPNLPSPSQACKKVEVTSAGHHSRPISS